MIKTGFFGGSFNPVHQGHIALAQYVIEYMGLDEIWFVVSPLNPFKEHDTHLIDDKARFEIVKQAVKPYPKLVASDCEFDLPRPSYTYLTLRHLVKLHPDREFSLIIGADNWNAFDKWSHHDEILAHHHVIVYPRRGCFVAPGSLPQGVTLVDAPLFPVSSTEIRRAIMDGKDMTAWLPPNAVASIHRMYSACK